MKRQDFRHWSRLRECLRWVKKGKNYSVLLDKPDSVTGWMPVWQSFILLTHCWMNSCDLPRKKYKRTVLYTSYTWSCSGWGLSIPKITLRMVGFYPAVSPVSWFSVRIVYFSVTLSAGPKSCPGFSPGIPVLTESGLSSHPAQRWLHGKARLPVTGRIKNL